MKKRQSATLIVELMKLTVGQIILSFIFVFSLYAKDAHGQDNLEKPVTINVHKWEITKIIAEVERQTSVKFIYSPKAIEADRKITCNIANQKLRDFLGEFFKSLDIDYSTTGEQVVLFKLLPQKKAVPETSVAEKFASYEADKTLAAGIIVSGEVMDNKGSLLQGVTVKEKGVGNATTTNEKGFFKINVKSETSILEFSAVSYVSREMTISKLRTLSVELTQSSKELDDVVVVGYGTQKKVNNTGAQASMTGKLLVASPVANIGNSLVGRISGLFASQASGEPGNDQSTLRIRGVGTFNGSTDPLVLVDGIQVDNYNSIDPNEIENVTVLKDASSTAVYGIRGANGVIIITTKRGKTGPAKVAYTFNEAINSFTALRSQMNSYDYASSFNQALKNDSYVTGTTYTPKYSQADLDKYKATVENQAGADPVLYPNVNWFDVMLKKASMQQQHNINISGGTDKIRYVTSVGYFNQEGLFKNTTLSPGYDADTRFKRYNFRTNLNFNINKRFKAAIDISSQIENRTGNNLATATVMDGIQRANPLSSPGIVDGKLIILAVNGANQSNPLSYLYQSGYKREYRSYLNGSVRVDHDLDFITNGLSTHAQVAYQNFNSQLLVNAKSSTTVINYLAVKQADGTIKYLPLSEDQAFSYSEAISKNRRITAEFAFDYNHRFGNHNVTGLLLYNQLKSTDPTFTFAVPNGYQSYVARATYDYKGRYLAEVNMAYNGTENFAPGKRFGLFPAYSAGWILSEEPFFPKNNVFTFLKFRGSYGEVGNDQVGTNFLYSANRFLFRPTAWTFPAAYGYRFGEVATGYNQLGGSLEGRVSNPNLTWERALKSNLGIEMSFWKKNISLNVDLFSETRNNILTIPQTVSGFFAASVPALNIGKMQNKGYEVEFTLNNNIGKFNYQVKANYSYAHNTILFQDEVTPLFAYEKRTGNRYGQYFGLIADGLYNSWSEVNDAKRPVTTWQGNKLQPGDIRYKDVNGDGRIDNDDNVPIGYSNIPEKTFGLSLVGQYKGWSVSVLFQGVSNVSLQYSRRFNQAFYDANPAGALNNLLESWTPERYAAGLPINFPRFSLGTNGNVPNNYQSSTFFTVDASYIRLKNAEVGYTINGRHLRKMGLSAVRIFANANNLVTITKVAKGIDPENPTLATNSEPYPLVRTINMGININL